MKCLFIRLCYLIFLITINKLFLFIGQFLLNNIEILVGGKGVVLAVFEPLMENFHFMVHRVNVLFFQLNCHAGPNYIFMNIRLKKFLILNFPNNDCILIDDLCVFVLDLLDVLLLVVLYLLLLLLKLDFLYETIIVITFSFILDFQLVYFLRVLLFKFYAFLYALYDSVNIALYLVFFYKVNFFLFVFIV